MLSVTPIEAFSDNYIWCVEAAGQTGAFLVDPGDGDAALAHLEQRGLELAGILITHHHFDHTGGLDRLLEALPEGKDIPVFGPHNPAIGQITHRLAEGDHATVLGADFEVLEVPGHTLDHIAFFNAGANAGENQAGQPPLLFCGDTLFAGGCGRLFEGDPATMSASLSKLAALPADTEVYCAHEYTLANLAFARAAEPGNAALLSRIERDTRAREDNIPTVPSRLQLELETNPFLRCAGGELARHMQERDGVDPDDPVAVFAAVRSWKDGF